MAFNIITNNCLGGHIYRDVLKTEYKNPFIWCFLEPYFDFIQNYPNINLFNYKLEKIDKKLGRFKIVIDNKYELKFWHYYFDKNAKTLIIDGRNVRYNKIWEYIVQKYEERTKRMLNKKEEPIFIIGSSNSGQQFTQKEQEKFLELTKYKMFLFSKYKFEKEIPNNITIINSFEYDGNNSNSVKIIYNLIK